MSPSSNSAPSRWCPTPEQVMILEEIYGNGLKTPNATQIQHITSHLSLYGKIEGKNVFYWFQNHKARDRQKLRRKLFKQLQFQHHQMLLKRHRFDDNQFFQCYFLHHHQRVPQQPLLTNPACFVNEVIYCRPSKILTHINRYHIYIYIYYFYFYYISWT